jgi:glycosyltransferase involved in cell wall biosynthesis
VVPYGRDVAALTQLPRGELRREQRSRAGIGDDERLAVCVSRLEPIKGIGELVDAWERVAERIPGAHLAIVGDASPKNEEAARFAARVRARHEAMAPGLRRRLHLPGQVSPCWSWLSAADFYVLPSYEECMSLAMLDAAILGLPVLGTNSGGTPSVARPEESGMLVRPGDAGDLARGLEALYSDPEACSRLGRGAARLGATFDQESIFAKIWGWYEASA